VSHAARPALQHSAQRQTAVTDLGEDNHAFLPPRGFLEASSGRRELMLPPAVLRRAESFFHADLSDVRVYVGPDAASIGAIAFTVGPAIHFAPGYYEPHTPRGQELLGHELTHVLQQREGRVANPLGDKLTVVQDLELEAEADRLGRELALGQAKMSAGHRSFPFGGPPAGAVKPMQLHAAQAKGAQYRLVLGAYLHGDRSLPEQLAGHSFVALESPNGERHAWGFSPAGYHDYDPRRDLAVLSAGVPGVVHDDASALERPGVRTHAYAIGPEQANAAMAKVAEYQGGAHRYSLRSHHCSAFALDVLRAANIEAPVSGPVRTPRQLYARL
jgi:hypothetical protein